MANTKISALTPITPVVGTMKLPVATVGLTNGSITPTGILAYGTDPVTGTTITATTALNATNAAMASGAPLSTLTGTMSSGAAAQYGQYINITPSGTAAQTQAALYANLNTGYTGSGGVTAAVLGANATVGTGTSLAGGAGNYGVFGYVSSNGGGSTNTGVFGSSLSGTQNIGVHGQAFSGTAVGVMGTSFMTGSSTNKIGVYAVLTTAAAPTIPAESAALLVDNGGSGSPVVTMKRNGTDIFKIPTTAGDGITLTAGTAASAVSAETITQTWNYNAAALTGVKWTFTDTSSHANTLAFQILGGAAGTTNLLKLSKAGVLTLPGGATFLTTDTALTDGAGASTGTITNAPSVGNPTKWIGINDNGTTRYIPAW